MANHVVKSVKLTRESDFLVIQEANVFKMARNKAKPNCIFLKANWIKTIVRNGYFTSWEDYVITDEMVADAKVLRKKERSKIKVI